MQAQGIQWTDVCGGMEHPKFALKEVTGRRALHANEPLADLAQQVIKSLPVRVHALQSLTEFYHRSIVKVAFYLQRIAPLCMPRSPVCYYA